MTAPAPHIVYSEAAGQNLSGKRIFNRTTNKYEMLPIPGYCNIYVEIEGSGTETDQDITVEDNVVKVGKEQNVKGKGYAFKGYIVEVRDGE
ncbi:MAG: DUF4330 domain-containing protein [Anaerotignum sp.]